VLTPDPRFLMAYCERLGSPAFWAEPLNALTNAAFLVAALLGALAFLRQNPRDWALALLAGIVAAIGIGSFLFHTIPNRITVMLDVLPIQAFILLYLGLALRRFVGLGRLVAIAGPILFLVASSGFVSLVGSRALGGGAGYVPALVALFGVGGLVLARADGHEPMRRAGQLLLLAGLVFLVSLTLRTLDRPLCGPIPFGLHFLWHLMNATVLGLLISAMARRVG
jgi:hypothetical protein